MASILRNRDRAETLEAALLPHFQAAQREDCDAGAAETMSGGANSASPHGNDVAELRPPFIGRIRRIDQDIARRNAAAEIFRERFPTLCCPFHRAAFCF